MTAAKISSFILCPIVDCDGLVRNFYIGSGNRQRRKSSCSICFDLKGVHLIGGRQREEKRLEIKLPEQITVLESLLPVIGNLFTQ